MPKPTLLTRKPATRSVVTAFFVVCVLLPPGALAESATVQTGADLSQLLRQQGWQTQSAPDGSLTLRPPGTAAGQVQAAPPISDAPSATTSASTPEIQHLLLQRGWRTETDAAGNTLLLPVGGHVQADQVEADSESEPGGNAAATADDEAPFAQFRNALSDKGWRVRSAADGSLMVFPPAQADESRPAEEAAARLRQGYCEGVSLAAVTQPGISLPIDSQREAAMLATDWIANFGQADDTVGRVRRIHRIYSVSIVYGKPPYYLRKQLIVRVDNGGVIPID